MKKELLSKIIPLFTRQRFLFKCPTLHIFKWQRTSELTIKCVDLQMIFFGLESEEINSYEQKHFREINNR